MTTQEFITRARSATHKNIKYRLGKGGMSPKALLPANMENECDCSGFLCWCLKISRQTDHPLYESFNQGWINTNAIVYDANSQSGFFSRLDAPRTGCIVVYPGKGEGKVGHVGIVTAVADTGTGIDRVIHCSSGNYRTNGDAIQETGPEVFRARKDTILAWYAGIEGLLLY